MSTTIINQNAQKLDLKKFIVFYSNFYKHPTWTKIKHEEHKILLNYMLEHEYTSFRSSSRSKISKVNYSNEFILFKVNENHKRYLNAYMNEWMIMYNSGKDRSTNYFEVYPIKNRVVGKKIMTLFETNGLGKRFCDVDYFITFNSTYELIKYFAEQQPLTFKFRYEPYLIQKKLTVMGTSPSNKNFRFGISRRLEEWLSNSNQITPWSSLNITFSVIEDQLRIELSNKIIDSKRYPDYVDKELNFVLDVNDLKNNYRHKWYWSYGSILKSS